MLPDIEIQQALVELSAQKEQIKTLFTRVNEQKTLTDSVHKLAISLERLTSAQKSTADKVDDLTGDVEELKNKPAKRWDSATTVVITAIITAVITFILTQVGLK
nr:MAG TPA: hypothetical protein [Caudoviricetes sp.]